MHVIYHPDAEAELVEAARFYERRVPHLGSEFVAAANRAVRLIAEAPVSWAVISDDVRHYRIPRFPYAIYYQLSGDEIYIVAFKHHSRDPDYWRYRLSE